MTMLWFEIRTFRAECSWCRSESVDIQAKVRPGEKPDREHLPPGWAIHTYSHSSYGMSSQRQDMLCPACANKWTSQPVGERYGRLETAGDNVA